MPRVWFGTLALPCKTQQEASQPCPGPGASAAPVEEPKPQLKTVTTTMFSFSTPAMRATHDAGHPSHRPGLAGGSSDLAGILWKRVGALEALHVAGVVAPFLHLAPGALSGPKGQRRAGGLKKAIADVDRSASRGSSDLALGSAWGPSRRAPRRRSCRPRRRLPHLALLKLTGRAEKESGSGFSILEKNWKSSDRALDEKRRTESGKWEGGRVGARRRARCWRSAEGSGGGESP